jgi:hypothetical protein
MQRSRKRGETVGETQRPVHMGLIVGYVMPNSHVVRPAMVVAVREVRRVNLVVFVDGRNDGHSEFGPIALVRECAA